MENCFIKKHEKNKKFYCLYFYFIGYLLTFHKIKKENIKILKIPTASDFHKSFQIKYANRICKLLHRHHVKNICIEQIEDGVLQDYLKREFTIFYGREIFIDIFPEVLKFFTKKKGYSLNECELVFIANYPEDIVQYLEKCKKMVKNISVFTNNKENFEKITNHFLKNYGIHMHLLGENDKIKKHQRIYINCEPIKIVKETFFESVFLIDIFNIYKGAFSKIILFYKTEDDKFLKENEVIKNLSFTSFYVKEKGGKADIHAFLKNKNFKIMNIKK